MRVEKEDREPVTALPNALLPMLGTRRGRFGRRFKRWLRERLPRTRAEVEAGIAHRGVLIIDDDPDVRQALALLLGHEGLEVAEAESTRDALLLLPRRAPKIIVLDLDGRPTEGIAFLETKRALWRRDLRRIPVLVTTCLDQPARRAVELGATAVIRKPFHFDALLESLDAGIAQS